MTTVPGLTIQNSQDCACVHSLVPCLAALLSAHFTPALLQSIRFVVLSPAQNGIRFMIQGTPSKLQCLELVQGRKFRNPPNFYRHVFREVLNLTLKNLPGHSRTIRRHIHKNGIGSLNTTLGKACQILRGTKPNLPKRLASLINLTLTKIW